MINSIKINPGNRRMVVISDVHGHLKHLIKLLNQLSLEKDDYLIILGDFINRGPNSYETLQYIQTLSQRKNTYILKGNHELFIETVMATYEGFKTFELFFKNNFYENIIQSMMGAKNISFDDFRNLKEVYNYLIVEFKEAFNFIKNLPIAVEDGTHLFIHGGYDESFDESDEVKFLKYDDFNRLSKKNKMCVVVGHWPCSNIRNDKIDNSPFFNDEKNIIFIDGGQGVKDSGELNALIIKSIISEQVVEDNLLENYSNKTEYMYDYIQVNDFKPYKVIKDHVFEKEETVHINYPDYEIEIINRGKYLSQGIHKTSGKSFSVFNELLNTTDQGDILKINYVNNFLNLKLNTKVLLVYSIGPWALVKYKDEFGWLKTNQIKIDDDIKSY